MQPSGVELIRTAFGIIGSLGGIILLIYKSVSVSIQARFQATKQLIAHQEAQMKEGLPSTYAQLRKINGRVTRLEVGLADHKEADRDIHDRERREIERRFIEEIKDLEELKKEVRKAPC